MDLKAYPLIGLWCLPPKEITKGVVGEDTWKTAPKLGSVKVVFFFSAGRNGKVLTWIQMVADNIS